MVRFASNWPEERCIAESEWIGLITLEVDFQVMQMSRLWCSLGRDTHHKKHMNREIKTGSSEGEGAPANLDSGRTGADMIWRTGIFLAVFALLQGWYSTAARDTWIERMVIDQVTVQSAAALIQSFDPSVGVQPLGSRLLAPGGGINVINGCEGIDVMFLLIAAMLVAPISMKARLAGMVIGILVTLALNQVRVIGLFYAYRVDRGVFDMLHGIVAPMLLIMAMTGYFLLWLNWHASTKAVLPTTS